MPTYDYECPDCSHKFERFQSMSADAIKDCPECEGDQVRRLIGAGAGLIFKGSGFYITDYRSKGYSDAKSKAEGGSKPSGEGGAKGGKAEGSAAASSGASSSGASSSGASSSGASSSGSSSSGSSSSGSSS
jgi:putative FmdB family regulatory protein